VSIHTFIAAIAGILLALAAAPSSAEAAKVCGPRERIISELGGRFNESRKSLGLSGTTAIVEL
jgi:hypothetical protein